MSEITLNITIKNIPDSKDYFERANELFIECFNEISILLHCMEESNDENERLNKKKSIDIRTKLHHISEIYLSGLIAKKNPLELIKIDKILDNEIIDFDDCPTIAANQLFDLAKQRVDCNFFNNLFHSHSFVNGYNENRKIRNKNMHSLVRNVNFDIKDILKDFLTIWHVFFRKNNFIKDFYKIILGNYFELEDCNLSHGEFLPDVIEKTNAIPFMKRHRNRTIKRKFLFRFIFLISNHLNHKELTELLDIEDEIKKESCFCPNCEGISRTNFSNGYIDYSEKYKYPYQPKTLLIQKDEEKAFCYLCGFSFVKQYIFKEICYCCNKKTYFINSKIKGFDYVGDEDINYSHQFCLYCGNTKDSPFIHGNLTWYE